MVTLRENRRAFARLRILPKVLVNVDSLDLRTTILGQQVLIRGHYFHTINALSFRLIFLFAWPQLRCKGWLIL